MYSTVFSELRPNFAISFFTTLNAVWPVFCSLYTRLSSLSHAKVKVFKFGAVAHVLLDPFITLATALVVIVAIQCALTSVIGDVVEVV
jgi:hypothetical protein